MLLLLLLRIPTEPASSNSSSSLSKPKKTKPNQTNPGGTLVDLHRDVTSVEARTPSRRRTCNKTPTTIAPHALPATLDSLIINASRTWPFDWKIPVAFYGYGYGY